jgi:aspartyl-tRNA(Asn)/glutamyl-tRNA(Gln) amidotransferase subunit C
MRSGESGDRAIRNEGAEVRVIPGSPAASSPGGRDALIGGNVVAKISRAEVERVARLARLALTEDEEARMTSQLDAILGYMETLRGLETEGVEPTTTVVPMGSVLREDAVRPSLGREAALANAPDREDVFFRVPRIIED